MKTALQYSLTDMASYNLQAIVPVYLFKVLKFNSQVTHIPRSKAGNNKSLSRFKTIHYPPSGMVSISHQAVVALLPPSLTISV
jgi:hypothetical protein